MNRSPQPRPSKGSRLQSKSSFLRNGSRGPRASYRTNHSILGNTGTTINTDTVINSFRSRGYHTDNAAGINIYNISTDKMIPTPKKPSFQDTANKNTTHIKNNNNNNQLMSSCRAIALSGNDLQQYKLQIPGQMQQRALFSRMQFREHPKSIFSTPQKRQNFAQMRSRSLFSLFSRPQVHHKSHLSQILIQKSYFSQRSLDPDSQQSQRTHIDKDQTDLNNVKITHNQPNQDNVNITHNQSNSDKVDTTQPHQDTFDITNDQDTTMSIQPKVYMINGQPKVKLSERDKMTLGLKFNVKDPLLAQSRTRAKALSLQFNAMPLPYSREDKAKYNKVLKELMPNIHHSSYIIGPVTVDYGFNIFIGKNTFLNANTTMLDVGVINIGDHVMIGPNCDFYTASHGLDHLQRRQGYTISKPITIENDVWIGGRCVVLPGVTIGARSVVGSGSVVVSDVPEDVFVVGNPLVIKRYLNNNGNSDHNDNDRRRAIEESGMM